jgi:hypothetical protein
VDLAASCFRLRLNPSDDFESKHFALFREANEAQDAGEPWVEPTSAEMVLADFFCEVDCLSNDPPSSRNPT